MMNEFKRAQLRRTLRLVWRWILIETAVGPRARAAGRKLIGYTIKRLFHRATSDEKARCQVDYLAAWVQQAERDPDEAPTSIRADMVPPRA